MRFLVDIPVTPQAVSHLEASGHDAVHATSVELASASDETVLERARAEKRIVVLALQKADGPGILLRGGSYSDAQMLALLDRVLERAEDRDLERSITVVDRDRIRMRRLPID